MMRVIFLLLVSSIAFQSNSQTWNNYLQKRFKSYGIWADSILLLPSDTTINKAAKSLAVKNGNLYIANGNYWTEISGGSSVVDSLVYATKANVIKVRDSLLAADNFWLGVNTFSNILKVDNQIKVGVESGSTGTIKFYNQFHTNTANLLASDTLANDVSIELPTSSGKLALTTDIAIVDTSIISTKAYVNYKDDIQQGFIDMRKLESDSSADNGYTSRARLKQYGDSLSASQAVLNGVQNDTLTSHNTRILANQNAANTNAANINLKVNIADTLPMLAGYKVATILTSGTLADARLSSNVPLKNTANTFTENQTISKTTPSLSLISATTNDASLTRGETVNSLQLKNKVFEVGGALSNAISLGSTSYLETNPTNITGLTEWSISLWYKQTGVNSIILCISDGTNGYNIGYFNANVYSAFAYNSNSNMMNTSQSINAWNHVVITRSSAGVSKQYLNGALKNTSTVPLISSFSKIRIGYSVGVAGVYQYTQPSSGQIVDQLLIYNKEINSTDVTAIYAGSTGTNTLPLTSNIIGEWEFDEGSPIPVVNGTTSTADLSGKNNNFTFYNSPSWVVANGKIPTSGTTTDGFVVAVNDGVLSGERGQYYFGDPFGGTILRGRSIKFQAPLETNFSFIHNGTSTLIDPANTNTSATGASTVSVVGNATIGENVAAPTSGLRVLGNALFRANTFFGGTTTPTARVHVLASSTSASGGQIKLIGGGSAQTVTEDGTINYIGNNLEFAQSTTVYKLAKTLQKSATLDFGSIASLATETLTITVTGVADGDQVSLGVPNGSMTTGLIYFAWVSAADTVSVQCYNATLSAVDPASGTFKISVIKQ